MARKSSTQMKDEFINSMQYRIEQLSPKQKRAVIKEKNPLFYAFGFKLEAPKNYLKEYDEPHY